MTPRSLFIRLSNTRSGRKALPRRRPPLDLQTLEERCVLAGTLTGVPFTSLNPQPVEGTPFTGQVATVFDSGPLAPTFGITINWGDGTTDDTTSGMATPITGSASAFAISGTHTYAEESGSAAPPFNFPVTVTVSDTANGISSITINSEAAVLDAALSPGNPVTGTPSVTMGVGGTNTSTTAGTANAALTAFEAAIGGAKNTAAAPQTGGFRTITWDGVKTDGSDSAAGVGSTVVIDPHTVGIPLDRFQGSGVFFGAVYAVSSDSFSTANPSTAGLFPPFSSPSTFAMFNDNGIDFEFVTASPTNSTVVSAASRGFGAIFVNVEQPNTTSIEYYNGNQLLATVFAPVGGLGQPVFVGALFDSPIVTRVNITLGTDVIFKFDGTTETAGGTDSRTTTGTNLVVTDDWAFAEPVATANGLPIVSGAQGSTSAALLPGSATAGVGFTGVVGTFTDLDPNGNAKDFTATINWGDGHLTNGTIAKNTSGGFDVSGTNTFAHEGVFPINIDVADFGGATLSINNTIQVADAPLTATAVDITATPNVAFTGTVATFTDADTTATASQFTASINWGDGSATTTGTITAAMGGGFTVAGTHTYASSGTFHDTITINDVGGSSVSVVGNVTVGTVASGGIDKLGAYRPSDGSWSLDSDGTMGFSGTDQVFLHFSPANVTGVAGDWTGTGQDHIGDFKNGVWHLDLNGNGVVDDGESFTFGQAGDKPVVGDWLGDGKSNLGVFRAAPDGFTGEFILDTNEDHILNAGDQTFTFGVATDRIVVGDWTGDGISKVGVFRDAFAFNPADAGDAVFTLDINNNHTFDTGDSVFVFGLITDGLVIGDWNGNGVDKVGVYRDGSQGFNAPGTALFSLDVNGNLKFDSTDSVFLFGVTTDQFVAGNWPVTPPLLPSQFAANGVGPGGVALLTPAELTPVLQQAIANWEAHGANPAILQAASVRIAPLGGSLVGWTAGNQITIDPTAAGWGWNLDTSSADYLFASPYGVQALPGSPAAHEMDLLTVVEHELGHELGLNDVDPGAHPSDLMAATLPIGTRRTIS